MRIAFVISCLNYGGAETQLIALSCELARRGHAVTVYTLSTKNLRLNELTGSGVSVIAYQKKFKLDPRVIWRLRKNLKAFRPDIVHGFLFDGNIYACIAAAGTGIPVLISERSDNYKINTNQRWAILLMHYLVSGVVANSHAGAEFARHLFHLSRDRFHVVWNGIDLESIDQRLCKCTSNFKREFFGRKDVKLACLVGNIRQAKDFYLALLVADRLTLDNPGWRVLFIGGKTSYEPEYYDKIMAYWQELGLQGRASFIGLRKDALEIMSQCDVVFSTSVREGFPNVVLEAMAVGSPVVSTDYSDIRMILPEVWQVVPNRAPMDLINAILQAAHEGARLTDKQSRWVAKHATITRSVDRLEQVYSQYLALRNRSVFSTQRNRL